MTKEELRRYSRQTAIRNIGESGQQKLFDSKVAVVGCGALGSMVAMQLAAAGVGNLVIADFDTVDISNLQRQLFFNTSEAGLHKADILSKRIRALNPDCEVSVINRLITKSNAVEMFSGVDFVVDATDNADSKQVIENACFHAGKTYCVAGVEEFHGQVMTVIPGGIRFSELFPVTDSSGVLPCSIAGVIGPAAALCASIQSSEAIKYLTGAGETLAGKLLTFNLLDNSFSLFQI